MGCSRFAFKRFAVDQSGCAMKVGTDGVLLGAWCDCSGDRILDAGTGSGLIALMAAQRNVSAMIDAVEIDPAAAECAGRNVAASPWSDRISVICSALQNFDTSSRYDSIISNPPYFSETLRSPDPARAAARHSCSLPHRELISAALRLLATGGRLSVILPAGEMPAFSLQASAAGLHLLRRCEVATKPDAAPKRIMSEWGRNGGRSDIPAELTSITVGSDEYRLLTNEFYLDRYDN